MSCPRSSQSKTSDAVDDFVRRFDPDEWLWIGVVIGQEQADGFLERTCAAVAAASELFLCQLREPALHLVDPGRVRGREVEVEPRMAQQPPVDQRRLVCSVIVEDEVDIQFHGNYRFNMIQKLAKLGGTVSPMQFTDDLASSDIQSGKQRGGAVAFVVVGAPLGLARSQRQRGLGAIERLDLALLIGAQHQGSFGRVEIQADDVAHLLDQLWIGRQFEGFTAMRLQTKGSPDPVDRLSGHTSLHRHRADAPVRGITRGGLQRLDNHFLDLIIADAPRCAAPRFVQQTSCAFGNEPGTPFAYRGVGRPQLSSHLAIRATSTTSQHDFCPHRQAVAGNARPAPRSEVAAPGGPVQLPTWRRRPAQDQSDCPVSESPVLVEDVKVDLHHGSGGASGPIYDLWGSFTVPANGQAILTQSVCCSNFDTSDSPLEPCAVRAPPADPRVPTITVTASGTTATISDTGHVLDTSGYDTACQGNESIQWTTLGSAPCVGSTLTLAPPSQTATQFGNASVTATFANSCGQPLSGAAVTFKVTGGVNVGKTGSASTNANGQAEFNYSTSVTGVDTLQASVTNPAGTVQSNSVSVTWARPTCQAYPIALSDQTIASASPGTAFTYLVMGTNPGQYGWLTWAGATDQTTLVTSLTPPGNSDTFVDPTNPADTTLEVGSWVAGRGGITPTSAMLAALNALETQTITVPIWDQSVSSPAKQYHVSGFARVMLTGYNVPNQRISLAYEGPDTTCSAPQQPTLTPTPTNTATLP